MGNLKNFFFIITAILIWSSYSYILKKTNVNPILFTFLTTITGWIFISIYLKLKHINIRIKKHNRIFIFFITIFFLINSITFFFAYQLTTIANAIFSHYLAPVFVSVLAPIFIKEKIEKITFISLIIAIVGMYFIFFPDGFKLNLSHNDILGISLGLISAIFYAFSIIAAKYIIENIDFLVLIFYQGLFTTIIATIFLPFWGKFLKFNYEISALIILTGFIHSFLAPILYLEGLKNIKAQFAGLLGYTEIVGSLLIGCLFFNEIPSFFTLLGGLFIICSGGIVILHEK